MADITAEALQKFLKQLGQCYRHAGRLYLVGGSSLILVAAKPSTLDVFHFDFYSIALSKLHRGNEKDYVDVIQMVEQDLITLPQLREQFREVLPQLESFDIRLDANDYQRNFDLFEQRLARS
jgi:hypothetical protein